MEPCFGYRYEQGEGVGAVRGLTGIPAGRRTKWLVLVFWAAVFALAGPLAGKLNSAQQNDTTAWLPKNAESTQVVELAKQNEGWLKSQRQGQGRGLDRTPTDENSPAGGGARRREAVIASQRRTWSADEQQDDMGSIGGCALGGPCRDGFLASRA